MTTNSTKRRITYKLYPSAAQAAVLERQCELLRQLYNGALEERITAYTRAVERVGKEKAKGLTLGAQEKSVTEIRALLPEYAELHTHACQVVLKRLQRAYENFWRRVREGAKEPGFPRFKSKDRWPGFGYKEHGNGFRFTPRFDKDGNWKHGTLYLSGVGTMTARGQARTFPTRICDCSIMRKCDGWFLSLVVECHPQRACGTEDCGLDWGVESYATIACENEAAGIIAFDQFENDRFWQAAQDGLKAAQRTLSKARRGKRSKRAAKARKHLARRWRRLANRRKNRGHIKSAEVIAAHARIFTESLTVSNITRSARGTVEKPGKNVKQKAGLNREILDTAPSGLLNLVRYKAEEAGCELIFLDTRRVKPSQTCPNCRRVEKKELSVRVHRCGCGFSATRDQASALTVLRIGRETSGREPARAARAA